MKLHGGTICSLCPIPGAGDGIWVELLPRSLRSSTAACPGQRGGFGGDPCGCRHCPGAWRVLHGDFPVRGDPKSFPSLPSGRFGQENPRGQDFGFSQTPSHLSQTLGDKPGRDGAFPPSASPSPSPGVGTVPFTSDTSVPHPAPCWGKKGSGGS